MLVLRPIAYAYRPRLRTDLTLSGRTFLRNLRLSASPILTDFVATCAGRVSSVRSTTPGDVTSLPTNAPYPSRIAPESRSFGDMLEPCWIVGPESLDQ